jgi:predicted anti-sigma-YlaC factor YlaD
MRCEQIGEMMSARLDERLTTIEDQALGGHLVLCSSCRGEWEALSAVDRFLSAAPVVAAPMDLHVRVLARLERRKRVRQALIGGSALSLGTLLLALLTFSPVVGWLVGAGSLLPMWRAGGPQAIGQVVSWLATAARTGAVLLRAFALPIVGVAACIVVLAGILNGLWIGALYRLQPTR